MHGPAKSSLASPIVTAYTRYRLPFLSGRSQLVPERVWTSTVAVVMPRKGRSTMKWSVEVGTPSCALSGGVISRTWPTNTASARQYRAHTGVPYSSHWHASTASAEIARQPNTTRRTSERFIEPLHDLPYIYVPLFLCWTRRWPNASAPAEEPRKM